MLFDNLNKVQFLTLPTRNINESSLTTKTIISCAWVVSKICFSDIAKNQDMAIAKGFHMAVVGGIQQHRVFVPFHLKSNVATMVWIPSSHNTLNIR